MGRRYHGTSISYSNDTYVFELWDGSTPDSPDTSIELIIGDSNLVYDKAESQEFKEKAPFGIMPSECTVQFCSMLGSNNTWDSSTVTNLENIATTEEQKWALRITKNGSFYWAGRVLADQMHFPFSDKYEFICEITAKDCLNLIDGFFVDPSWFTINTATRETAIVLISEILSQTGLLGYFPSDVFADAIAITNASFPANSIGKTSAYTTYNIASFIDNFDVTLTSDKIKYIGCKDALNNILKPFGARVCLAGGLYFITEPDGYQTSSFGFTTYTSGGVLNTYNTTLNHRVTSGVTVRPCWGAVPDVSFQKPIRAVEIQWDKQNYQVAEKTTSNTTELLLTGSTILGGHTAGNLGYSIKVGFEVNYSGAGQPPNKMKFKYFIAAKETSTGLYWKWEPNTLSWVVYTGPYFRGFYIENFIISNGSNVYNFSDEVGEIPSGFTLECGVKLEEDVIRFTYRGGSSIGYWNTVATNAKAFTGKILVSQAYTNTDPREYTLQHKYINNLNSVRATNSTYLEYAIKYYNATSIKDVGGLMIFNGTTYVAPGNWSVSWHSVTGDINKVLAENITGLYSNFLETINGVWHDDGDFHAAKSLYIGTKTYIFNGGTYNFKDDTWTGEWICVDTDYTLHTTGGLGERTTQKGGDTIKDKLTTLEKNVADLRAIFGVLGKGVIIPDIINNGTNVPTTDPGADTIYTVQLYYDYSDTEFSWRVQKKGVTDWITIPKTADETTNSDSTITADSELKFPMVANKTYAIRGNIGFSMTINGGMKFDFNGPSSPTAVAISGTTVAGTHFNNIAYGAVNTMGSTTIKTNITFTAVVQNGANAGNFEFRWAQDTSHADSTTVLKGSYIEYIEIN